MRRFNNYDLEGQPNVLAWNPLAMRCDMVNDGCKHCWHLRAADRLAINPLMSDKVRSAYAGKRGPVIVDIEPSIPSWRVVAVQFMGDLWHKGVTVDMRYDVLYVCETHPDTTFLLLTKRPTSVTERLPDNCWIGTSAHDHDTAQRAVSDMLSVRASNKWLSLEPLSDISIKPEGFGLFRFVAYGPSTIGGHETCDNRWMDRLADWVDLFPDTVFYDKRKAWTVRDWPFEWTK